METIAFQKEVPLEEMKDGSRTKSMIVKLLYYPRTSAVSVCVFKHCPKVLINENESFSDMPMEDSFYEDYLGIVAPDLGKDGNDASKLDNLFNASSQKTFYVVTCVTEVEVWKEILAKPLEFGKDICYHRNNSILSGWAVPSNAAGVKLSRFRCDCSCRWLHLATATGLASNDDDLGMIVLACHLLEEILFEPGPPTLRRTRHSCGSICAILDLLLEVASEYHGVIGYTRTLFARKIVSGEWTALVEGRHFHTSFGEGCENRSGFLDDHGKTLAELKNALIALPSEIRLEMLRFQFERTGFEFRLTMITSDYQPLWCTSKCRAITCASLDYSRLITGDNSESHFCYDNGLFHQAAVDDEDLNSFDDQTVSTEVSSEDEEEKADLV